MMHNMLTHTPGPWAIDRGYIVQAEAPLNAEWIADINNATEANARLMAAAPELLDALVRLYQVSTYASLDDVLLSYVRHAIAKARGES